MDMNLEMFYYIGRCTYCATLEIKCDAKTYAYVKMCLLID